MRKYITQIAALFVIALTSSSCTDGDKAIETVFAEIERGGVLRTIDRINENFTHDDLTSTFSIVIEEQSIETDNQFENVILFVKHIDRLPSGVGVETAEAVLRDIPSSGFSTGPNGLPRLPLEITYQEVVEALNLDVNTVVPGDQFEIRMNLTLFDGRSFSNDSASGPIVTDFCFFKSPYRYVINVIDPINQSDFTGNYAYQVLNNTNQDLQFVGLSSNGLTSIVNGNTANVRRVGLFDEGLQVTIAGDFIYPKIYQKIGGECRESELLYLSGPAESDFGSYDPIDDTVFEMDIVLDTKGPSPRQVRYRFTKQ